ncbi:MAG: hypothetical protein ACI36Y_06910 [Coriobacteriales bacterium]
MGKKGKAAKFLGKGLTCCTVAGAMVALSCGVGFAASASNINSSSAGIKVDSNLLTTMGARAGSAGPDFLGITNMNYDFQPSHTAGAGDPYPYYLAAGTNEGQKTTGYKADLAKADQFNRLAIWGSGVNTSANPYYQNLLADTLLGTATEGGLSSAYTKATTYHSNANSWGDVAVGGVSVVSADYAPNIIFGANKYTNWKEGDFGTGTLAKAAADKVAGYNPSYANNDASNIWTQIYSLQQLAATADKLTAGTAKYTRYNNSSAAASALAYEKSIKGQMLYIASQLKANGGTVAKKKVAYLYAIDQDAGKAYFFVPQASGLTKGSDTGAGVTTGDANSANQDVYASNNSTINMGYMATLPFITNTFGTAEGEGTVREGGIQMIVEDIYKRNPVVEVSAASSKTCMKDVDLIIYNTQTQVGSLKGTSNGLCIDSDIVNTAALTDESVAAWAKTYGFAGKVLAGDDYGTSTKQNAADTVGVTTGSSPILYCARNYTIDKNARAAWAFSKVYPELYGGNDDASYAYWLENVYHIQTAQVNSVLAAYTHQSASTVNVYASNTTKLNTFAKTGYTWYMGLASDNTIKKNYAYYTGSSRASYYSGNASAEEPSKTIGIFQPSTLWVSESAPVLSTAKSSITVKRGKSASVKIIGAKKAVTASITSAAKKAGLTVKATKTKLTVKAAKTAKTGTYTVTLKSSGATKTTVKVKVTK